MEGEVCCWSGKEKLGYGKKANGNKQEAGSWKGQAGRKGRYVCGCKMYARGRTLRYNLGSQTSTCVTTWAVYFKKNRFKGSGGKAWKQREGEAMRRERPTSRNW